MGIGPAPATQKLLARLGLTLDDFDVIELNEAFAAPGARRAAPARPRRRRCRRVNPNGGAIALGHPLGMSGARLALHRDRGAEAHAAAAMRSPPCASASARASRSRSNGCSLAAMSDVLTLDHKAIMAVLDKVPDPEIPALTITDLGMVRGVFDDPPRVRISPTYTGCPATTVIENSVREALDAAGLFNIHIERVLFPPWTTDWITRAAASASTIMGSHRRAPRQPPNARNARRSTRSRSAASAQPRARHNGNATPAWSRSTASNAISDGRQACP